MSDQIRFTHVNQSNRLRYTVAYNFQKSEDGTLNVTYGVAQCSKNDAFNRAAGRALATGRLNKLNAKEEKAKEEKATEKKAKAPVKVKVPMSGKFSVQDAEGLRVGQMVVERFEADRKNVLSILDGQK